MAYPNLGQEFVSPTSIQIPPIIPGLPGVIVDLPGQYPASPPYIETGPYIQDMGPAPASNVGLWLIGGLVALAVFGFSAQRKKG